MSKTEDNLKTAFAGESQANQKYNAFAKKAERDGFKNIARLFSAAAQAEKIHAEGHLSAMDGIGSTEENLNTAIAGETYEYTEMYPPMLEAANAENHKAKRMFGYALKAEEVHAKLYKMALEAVVSGRDLGEVEIYICPVCGNIELGKPTVDCPICGTKAVKYLVA